MLKARIDEWISFMVMTEFSVMVHAGRRTHRTSGSIDKPASDDSDWPPQPGDVCAPENGEQRAADGRGSVARRSVPQCSQVRNVCIAAIDLVDECRHRMNWLFKDFVFLWTVVDPIGSVPVFIALAAGRSAIEQRRIAFRAIAIAAGILLFFIVAGQLLLDALSIELSAFQIAGGIIMFIFALDMVFGEPKPEEEKHLAEHLPPGPRDIAVYPLAVPSIAGPGTMMAVVLLTDNHRHSIVEQMMVATILLTVLAITLGFLLMAGRIQRLIGDAGASIVSRVMGLIIAAMAASTVLAGVKTYFKIGV